jgi:curved DNA-binding protein CbpA
MAKERLTEERKQQLEELYLNLRRHNFYSILGVAQDADRARIRRAYFSLSKLCHPDSYADKDLGRYRVHMEKIFHACSKAYDVLTNVEKRRRYDEYLARKADTTEYATNLLGRSMASTPPPGPPAGEEQAVQDRVQMPEEPPVVRPSAPPSASHRAAPQAPRSDPARQRVHERRRRAWRQSAAKRGLLGALGDARNVERLGKSKSWMERAQDARESGETLGALNALRMAIDSDPDNDEARRLLDEVTRSASGELSTRYLEQARAEMGFGEHQLARTSIARALEFDADNADILMESARIELEAEGDLHRAYEHAQRAARHMPDNAKLHLLMGRILLKAGLPARARSVITRAGELDPGLEEVKSLLAQL